MEQKNSKENKLPEKYNITCNQGMDYYGQLIEKLLITIDKIEFNQALINKIADNANS